MNVFVYGAGAVGSMLGGFLARAGHRVTLLGRPAHMSRVAKSGLNIRGIWGDYHVDRLNTCTCLEEIAETEDSFDLALLTVKSFDTKEAVRRLAPLVQGKTTLLTFQNGLGNIETVLERIDPARLLVGRIITGVDLAPGEVRVTVSADAMAIGSLPDTNPVHITPDEAARLLTQSGVPARSVPHILTYVWSKVIYNCALNGPCSILEIPYGQVLARADTLGSLRQIVKECYDVASKQHVMLTPKTAEEYTALLTNELIPKTARHYPSMLQDLRRGRRTEVDALNGAVARLGKTFGIPTPENERIANLIRHKEASTRR